VNRWLVDASVLLAAEDPDDENHDAAVGLLEASDPLLTLDLALYEAGNVALRAWRDEDAAVRLRRRLAAIADDGGMVRGEPSLLERAERLAAEHDISVYDAAYVAAASTSVARLVSCDVRDLVSRGLAVLPAEALEAAEAAEPPTTGEDDAQPATAGFPQGTDPPARQADDPSGGVPSSASD
jgi:predicted nucleic acid-binding protein